MKILIYTTAIALSSLIFNNPVQAQEMTNSIVHQISKKANKGELYDYSINEAEDRIELAYLLKETKKTMFMETYVFKLSDLSFVSNKEEELQKEKVKYKRVKWGRTTPTKLLKITPNFVTGNLVLKRGYISYGYAGRAVISSFVSDDRGIKIRTQGGDKFIYLMHQTESDDLNGNVGIINQYGKTDKVKAAGTFGYGYVSIGEGNVSLIGMEKTKPYYSKYALAIYDAETRSEKLYKTFDLGYSYSPISAKYLANGNVGIVFWPIQSDLLPKSKGVAEKFKFDPDKNFKYIEINTVGEKVTDVSFNLEIGKKGGSYNFDIIQSATTGEIVLLGLTRPEYWGASPALNPKVIAPTHPVDSPIAMHKPEKVTVIKIANNKVLFTKTSSIENLTTNIQTTDDTKTPKTETLLMNYKVTQAVTDKNGNILVNGIRDVHEVIQIDNEGNITAYLDNPNQDVAMVNELIENSSKEVYWVKFDVPKYDPKSNEDMVKALHKRTGTITKIDSENGKLGSTISLTPEDITLDEQEPVKWINENEILVLGAGKKKEISLAKISIK